jgi:two-component system, cell cycle sensor histidine kinase PleC
VAHKVSVLRRSKLLLIGLAGIFALAALYTTVLVFNYASALRQSSPYNFAWAAGQAVGEFARLEERVAAYGLADSATPLDEVQLRFNIVRNRITVLRDGGMADFIARFPDHRSVIEHLSAALEASASLLDPSRIDRLGTVREIRVHLAPVGLELSRFAAAANQFGGERTADGQQQLITLHWIFSTLAGGLILCGGAFLVLLLFQNREIRRAHDGLTILTRELSAARERAEVASTAKSRFLANMSHELRTPLNAIIGFSEMIKDEMLGPAGMPQYPEYAGHVVHSGMHMLSLVNDILTTAKLEAGTPDLDIRAVNTAMIVEEVTAMLRGNPLANDREIAIVPGSVWPLLLADKRALKQMLLNLLSNALKFSAPPAPVLLEARFMPGSDLFEISVSDRGIGMTQEQAALAILPFQQIDDGMSRRYEGTGLGLTIVKGLIEAHSGHLRIDSEPKRGTRVSLLFPSSSVIATEGSVAKFSLPPNVCRSESGTIDTLDSSTFCVESASKHGQAHSISEFVPLSSPL